MDMGWIQADETRISSEVLKFFNPKNPVFKPFYLCIFCYQRKKRPHNHISMVTRSSFCYFQLLRRVSGLMIRKRGGWKLVGDLLANG